MQSKRVGVRDIQSGWPSATARKLTLQNDEAKEMARPLGFEPKTLCLEGRCSIQLSYGRNRKDTKGWLASAQARLSHGRGDWGGFPCWAGTWASPLRNLVSTLSIRL